MAIAPRQDSVTQFMQIATQLINEAAAYAASGVSDPEASANIRQLRVMSAALNASLNSITVAPPMPPQSMLAPRPV